MKLYENNTKIEHAISARTYYFYGLNQCIRFERTGVEKDFEIKYSWYVPFVLNFEVRKS